jgi:Transposase DDE domain
MELAIVPRLHRGLRSEGGPDPLQEKLARHVEHSVVAMLDPDRIEALAEDMRLFERKRVHHAGLVVCAFVLSAFERSTDTEGRLLDARMTYEQLGGPRSGKGSFRRMAHKLLPVWHQLVRRRLHALAQTTPNDEMRGRLAKLTDVLIPDGCAFKLARALAGLYPGTGTVAELKLHAVYSVRAGASLEDKRTAGRTTDTKTFWPETWTRGALYLWDLGYQDNQRFVEATEAGAYVLQRLKEISNPVVLASYGPAGEKLDVLHDDGTPVRIDEACEFGHVHRQAVLDLDVVIEDDKKLRRKVKARVVCVPYDGEDRYYLTTLPRTLFSAHDIAELYRMRWEVELLFRQWRGAMRMDEVRRLSNPKSLDLAVTSSLLAALLGRDIHAGLERLCREHAEGSAAVPPF